MKKSRGRRGGSQRAVNEENWERLLDAHGPAEHDPGVSAQPMAAGDAASAAIVISVSSGRCKAFRDGVEIDCAVPADMAVRQKSLLAVGDRVNISDEGGLTRITSVLPRHSVLARPDPLHAHRQRLIAANVDVVVHVVSLKTPPLRPRLIDRFLIAIQRGGAQPIICVNKIDLLEPRARAEELRKLEDYRALDIPVVPCSTQTGEGIDILRAAVEGKTCALVGHSGVGKSSILNALDKSLDLVTNTLHKRGTGRHTTSASTLYDLGEGTWIIDTPGIREFGLWNLDRDSLRDYFPEFEEPSQSCRFTDCTHVHEPNCEVKEQVEQGSISRARYDTYVRLYEDVGQES
ncbi:MAG: ribosome small subunit-dependent GTPase A [Acidobacteriota bacterium]